MSASAPVFIVGVPRSGTTLLRVILDSHPALAVGPECPWIAGAYGQLASFKDLYQGLVYHKNGVVANFSSITEKEISGLLGEVIHRLLQGYAEARGKRRWLEKTPNHIAEAPFLLELFPASGFIHVVRDGRDVACSSFNARSAWGRRLVHGGEHVANTRLNALRRWCQWVHQFHGWQQQLGLSVCQVRYEDLVRSPQPVLEEVLAFLDEPWDDDLLRYGEATHDMPAWEAGSRDVAHRPEVSDSSVGRWKQEFTATERLIAASLADALLTRLGYDPTVTHAS